MANPEVLMASDSVVLSGLNNAGIVETILPPEPEPLIFDEPINNVAISNVPIYTIPADNIQIAGKTVEIIDVASTEIDAGNHVNKYGEKFLYGHNSAGVFGSLYNMSVGNVFTINHDGVGQNYQVSQIVIFEKNDDMLQIAGEGNYMGAVARARYSGVNYDLSIMTCYGVSYGNGDASHRLVLFANAL